MMPMIIYTEWAMESGFTEKDQQSQYPWYRLYPVQRHCFQPGKGMELEAAVAQAKRYLSAALEAQLDLGRGSGPMDHGFAVRRILSTVL